MLRTNGISLRTLIEDAFSDIVYKDLEAHTMGISPREVRGLFEDHIILEPATIQKVEGWRPLYDQLEEALDDLWGLSHDTIPMNTKKAVELHPDLIHILPEQHYSYIYGHEVILSIPVGGLPKSVAEFIRMLALLKP